MTKTIIKDLSEVPKFASEVEEQAFWEANDLDADLFHPVAKDHFKGLERTTTHIESKDTPIRLEHDITIRLKNLALIKGTKYQTLMKQFIAERLYEEEKREGVL